MRFTTRILLLVSLAATLTYAQTLPSFQHVIIVFQENRTPDNLFGSSPNFETGVDLRAPASGQWCLGACFDPNHTHGGWENMPLKILTMEATPGAPARAATRSG